MPTDRPLQPWNDWPAWPGRDDLLGGWVLGPLLLPWSWRRPAGNWVLRPSRLCSVDRRRVGCGVVPSRCVSFVYWLTLAGCFMCHSDLWRDARGHLEDSAEGKWVCELGGAHRT